MPAMSVHPLSTLACAAALVVACAACWPSGAGQLPALNVTDFGAVPNDQNDDTAAFEQALAQAAQGGVATVYVPAGRYLLATGRLRPQSGVTVQGEGSAHSVLQVAGQGDPDVLFFPEGEDITFRDLALRGRAGGVPPRYDTAGTMISMRRVRRLSVERCSFEQFKYGVHAETAEGGFYTVSDVAVSDSHFASGGVGVGAQACERIAVRRCRFEDMYWAAATSRCLGSRFESNDVRRCVTGVRGLHAFDVHVNHNTFRQIGSNGAVQFDTAVGGEISFNVIDNQDATAGGWNLEVEAASGIVISGNVIRASQHVEQSGIWLHGRSGGWSDWEINPFDPLRADFPEYEKSFIEGAPEEVATWTVAQPQAVTLASDSQITWRDHPSFRMRIEPGAKPGVLAWRPYTPDQQHRIYGDMIVGFVAVRGNTAPLQALGLSLCLGEAGQRPAQTLLLPSVGPGQREQWFTYRSIIYEQGAGFGFTPQFAPFASIAVVLREPLQEPVELWIGTFRRDFAWQSNRDAGTVVSGNTISNAWHGIVVSQLFKNLVIVNNVLEASQSRLNRGNMAVQLLTWHTVVRDRGKQVDPQKVPPDAPADWVPLTDPVPSNPEALIYENCRISDNTVQGYEQFIGVAGPDNGRFILQEPRLGLRVENNQLQQVGSLMPAALPACVSVQGNARDNYPLSGTLTLEGERITVGNPNFTATCAVRLTPLSPEAFAFQPRIVSLGEGKLTVERGAAPTGTVYAWEIFSDHLPR